MNDKQLFFLVAGEPSGDMLGARLMAALRDLTSDSIQFAGVGGEAMAAEGLDSLFPMEELSVMGVFELLPDAAQLWRRMRQTARKIDELQPAAVVTIDAPAFAHGVVNRIRDRSIPRVHYVAPTVWAWRPWRVRKFRRHFHHLLALLPFEPPLFVSEGLPCSFVGHPVVESGAENGDGLKFRQDHGIDSAVPILCMLLGSRRGEVAQLAAIFSETVRRLTRRFPKLVVVAPTVATLVPSIQAITAPWPVPSVVIEGHEEKYDAMAASNVALAASGTVSLELAMAGVPSIVTYRLPWLTYFVVKWMSHVRFVTLINIILGRDVVPELLQGNCTPDQLCEAVTGLLQSGGKEQVTATHEALERLGIGDERPSIRAARALLRIVAEGPETAPDLNTATQGEQAL